MYEYDILLSKSAKALFPDKVTFTGMVWLGLQHILCSGIVQLTTLKRTQHKWMSLEHNL